MKLRRTSIALKFIFLIFVLVGSANAESTNISSEEFLSNDQLVDKNPFTSGSPEQKNCLRQALGEELYNIIALERRPPTEDENNLMEPCMAQYFGQRDNSKDSRNQNDKSPFTSPSPELKNCLRQVLGDELYKVFVNTPRKPTREEEDLIQPCIAQTYVRGFISGSPELKDCLRQTLGEESFNSIALGRRLPTKKERNLIDPCFSGQRDNSKDSRNQNDKNPFISSLPDLTGVIERCNQRPVLPAHGYQGLLTDVHVHTRPSSDSTQVDFAYLLLEEMNANGVDRVVIQPNHSPLRVAQNRKLDSIWGEISAICPRIIPMLYGFNPDALEDMEYVEKALATGRYGGVGEIEFQHGNLDISYDPESESMLKIYDMLEEKSLPLHLQADLERDPRLEDILYEVISSRPGLNFVWFQCPEQFLALRNVYCDIFVHVTIDNSDNADNENLRRSLIGSDMAPAGFPSPAAKFLPYDSFGEAMVQAREALAELPIDVADTLAHENFDFLWPKPPVAAKLRTVLLPEPTHLTPKSATCATFQNGQCAELLWERIDGLQAGEFTSLQVSPTDPNVIYAGIDANDMSLWRSDDAGTTWNRRTPDQHGGHVSGMAISPVNPDIVLYTTLEGDVLLTSDGGRNWRIPLGQGAGGVQFGPGGVQFTAVAFSANNPNLVYVAAAENARRPLGKRKAGPSDFYVSNDAGLTWNLAGTCNDCGTVKSIVVEPEDSKFVWIAGDGGVQRSTDGGKTWSGNQLRNQPSSTTIGLALNPMDSRILLVASSEAGVFRTEDGGQTWKEVNAGLRSLQTHRVTFAPNNPKVAYLTAHDGVYRSEDGGQTWEQRSYGLGYTFVHAITVDPTDSDTAYVGTASEVNTTHGEHFNGLLTELGKRPKGLEKGLHEGEGLYKTTDGGRTWHRSDKELEEATLVTMSPHPLLPFNLWTGAAAGRGAFFTPDAGDTWLFSPVGAAHYAMVFAFSRTLPTSIYLSSFSPSEQLVVSTNGGKSWQNLTESLTDGVSQTTKDLGFYHKSKRPHVHIHGLAVAPSDSNVIYTGSVAVADSGGGPIKFDLSASLILKSQNGGVTWDEMNNGFPIETLTSINAIVVHPTDPDTAYVMTSPHESETAIGIYKTTNGGVSWSAANNGLNDLNTNDLQLDPLMPNTLYVATDSGVYKTIDGAQTWKSATTNLPMGTVYDLAMDPINPLVLYAATTNGVYQTKNGGGWWYEVNLGLPLASKGLSFNHDRVIEVDATGRVVYISIVYQNDQEGLIRGDNPSRAEQNLLYRAIIEPLQTIKYVFELKDDTVQVESTSHVYDVVFDERAKELRFTAAGPANTRSETAVTVPPAILTEPFTVTVDEKTTAATSEEGIIRFEFTHIGRSKVVIRGVNSPLLP
jgi:photosystem II stability/assembly factor-like uncharacterized protein